MRPWLISAPIARFCVKYPQTVLDVRYNRPIFWSLVRSICPLSCRMEVVWSEVPFALKRLRDTFAFTFFCFFTFLHPHFSFSHDPPPHEHLIPFWRIFWRILGVNQWACQYHQHREHVVPYDLPKIPTWLRMQRSAFHIDPVSIVLFIMDRVT